MKRTLNLLLQLALLLLSCLSCLHAQGVGVRLYGADMSQAQSGRSGGYYLFKPVTYNPYNGGSPCYDNWTNPTQQPLAVGNLSAFGLNDLLLWNSLSPSLKFNGPFVFPDGGLVQGMKFNVAGASGPCGSPLPVNTLYGLNTNGYFFGRGGLATDSWLFNSIQSLQGGGVFNSVTLGTWYPTGTTICTSYNGASCTATAVIAAGVCPGGAVGCYLGGHIDIGHSVGPPASGGIDTVTNPYSGGEGAVQGQMYWDDGLSCVNVYNGTSWSCIGGVTSFNTRTGSVTLTAADVSAVEQDLRTSASPTFAATTATTFNCTATGATNCAQQSSGTWKVTGAGNAAFQSVAVTNGVTVGSGAYGLSSSGILTASSCIGCGGVTLFNARTGSVTLTAADVSAVEQDLRTSASPTFAAITVGSGSTTGNFTVGSGGTLYALGSASISNVLAVVNGIIDTGYLTVSGAIVSNGHTGFTGTLAAAIASGLNISNGIIY